MTATAAFRVGEWLPSDEALLDQWVGDLITKVEAEGEQALLPVIDEFRRLIEDDPEVYMLFRFMLQQVPHHRSRTHEPQVKTVGQLLGLFNYVLTHAPEYNDSGLVGCPINAVLDWAMGTRAGFAAFLNDRVNNQLKKLLNEWGVFLKSADSAAVLNGTSSGWLGPNALAKMPNFAESFVCDPARPYYGFTSWDDFFTRQFRAGVRPVASPANPDVVVNACESAP